MEKHTVSTLLHKPEEYSIDMGVLGNVATTFAAAKKTQSVIRMAVVKSPVALIFFLNSRTGETKH